jgi:hypothetical protein
VETWKDVKGYESIYQISDLGRIKSLKRKVSCKNGSFRELPEKIIIPLLTSRGYLNIVASRKQVRETLIIHQLVAEHFIGIRPEGLVIDHIDRDKTNNRLSNLRYVTRSENQQNRSISKLTKMDVCEILGLLGKESQSKIAEKFGVSQSMISQINLGRRWKSAKEETNWNQP